MASLKANGNTDNWPYMVEPPVLSAFEFYNKSLPRKDFPVYLIHSGDRFSKYLFQDIEKPTHLVSGKTYRKGKFLYFVYNPDDDQPGTVMSELLNAEAIISDDKGQVIYGDKKYCIAKLDEIPLVRHLLFFCFTNHSSCDSSV